MPGVSCISDSADNDSSIKPNILLSMKILYLQCNMGAAGDMLTASLASLLPDPNVYLDTINGTGLMA